MTVSIFKCSGNEIQSIPDSILEELSLSYEEIKYSASNIAKLSKTLQNYKDTCYCELPFCHTLEAEALGSTVTYDQKFGNRINKFAISDINLIEDIKNVDLSKGRIAEVLKAVNILKKSGENVIFNVIGPITLGTSIMDSQMFFRTIIKDAEKANRLLEIIENCIIDLILEGIRCGADIISFADPAGTMDIVGPRVYKEVSGKATYNILKKLECRLGSALIHLCGKTSTSLEYAGFLETENVNADGEDYFHMIKNMKNDDVKFIGNWCFKIKKKKFNIVKCILK